MAQRARIREHQARLVEGADQILTQGVIDTRLASKAGVHLRHDGRRHLHNIDTAQKGGCHESSQVTDNTTTESGDPCTAIESCFDHRPNNGLNRFKSLAPFALAEANHNDFEASALETVQYLRQRSLLEGFVVDQRAPITQTESTTLGARFGEQAVSNDVIVGTAIG
jgi:hypothetical protein